MSNRQTWRGFERHLESMPRTRWRTASIHACDSADTARRWLAAHCDDYTAGDVVALAELIIRCRESGLHYEPLKEDDR